LRERLLEIVVAHVVREIADVEFVAHEKAAFLFFTEMWSFYPS
jgi:hypothetical protein